MTGLVVAVAAGSAVLLAGRAAPGRTNAGAAPRSRRRALMIGVPGSAAVLAVSVGLRPAVVVAMVVVLWRVQAELDLSRRRAEAIRRSRAVVDACDGVAADLRAGVPPMGALATAAEDWPELRGAADAARLGADVPRALRGIAELPGAAALRLVAAAWVVAHRSGAGLADAVGATADLLRDEQELARVVTTELASARATAGLLAVLPVGVLVLGRGVGGDPVGFLLGTAAGGACLVGGVAFGAAGWAWIGLVARRAERW